MPDSRQESSAAALSGYLVFFLIASLYTPLDAATLLLPLCFLLFPSSYKSQIYLTGPGLALFGFATIVALSLFLSIDFSQSLVPSLYLILILFNSVLLGKSITSTSELRRLIFFCCAAFLLIGVRNIFAPNEGIFRAGGIAGQPNALGLLSGTGVIISSIYIFLFSSSSSKLAKIIAFTSIGINLYWLLQSASRGAIISAILTIIYLIFSRHSLSKRIFLIIAAFGIALILLNMRAIQEAPAVQRMLSLPAAVGLDLHLPSIASEDFRAASDDIRLDLVKQAFKGFLDSPWLGNGAGVFSHYSSFVYTHTTYLEILFSYGLCGISLFFWFLYTGLHSHRMPKLSEPKLLNTYKILNSAKLALIIFFLLSGISIPNFQSKTQIPLYMLIIAITNINFRLADLK